MSDSQVHLFVASGNLPMSFLRLDDWQEAFPRHWHEEWGFAVIKQGTNRFWFRGAWYNAGPGAVVVVPPGEVHDGGLKTDEPWGEHMCYVPTATMARIVEDHTGVWQEPHFESPIINDKSIARSLLGLHRRFADGARTDPLEASEDKISS